MKSGMAVMIARRLTMYGGEFVGWILIIGFGVYFYLIDPKR